MTNQHRLLPINLQVELDRRFEPREVVISDFEVVVREAPVVGREGEVVVVVAEHGEVFNNFAPDPAKRARG